MKQRLWHKRALVCLLALVVGGAGLVVADAPPGSREPAAWPSVREAPDSATAIAAARRQQSPVRVADLTTETRLVHAKPDGTMAAEMTTVPVRVRRGDTWVPVDTTVEVRPDGSVGPRATVTEVAFSSGGDGPLVRYGVGDSRVTLSWPGRLPKPVLTSDTATYPEVYPGVDLVMRANNAGYTQHVVVKNRRAAAAVRDIRLGMATVRLKVTVTRDGAIEGRDPGGQAVFRSPPSLMWDSGSVGMRKQALAKVTAGRKALVITPDAKLLADPETTFPVVIDPAPTQLGKSAWGGVYSGNSDQSYFNSTADPEGRAQVGQCNWSNCAAVVGIARTYFQYDTRWLGGKELVQAYVNTVAVYRPDCNWHEHRLYWVHGQYGPGMSWDAARPLHHEAVDTRGVAGARPNCADPNDYHFGFNTNRRVNFGGFSSYMIGAADEGNSGAWRKYDQHRTVLYVEYNTKPNAPTELSVVPWRAACKNCGGKVYLGDDFVKLRARLSDPDGDQVRPRWTVNGVAAETGWVNSGDLATYDVDTRGKPDQSEYQWSAATADWRDWSGTVGGPSFVVDRKSPVLAPTVTSDLYPADNRWHGGTGVPGVFTFTPNFAANELRDVDHYRYGWDDAAPEKVDAPALNAPVSISITPPGDGPRDLHVYSVDRAGRLSPRTVYHFYVRAGNGPLAQWSFEGNAQDTAFLGFRHGTPAGGTVYAPGAVGTAVTLDPATQGRVTAPNTVNTKTSFSVSAWVKPDSGVTHAAVVSQEGPHFPGFVLWHWLDSTGNPRWVFGMAQNGDTYVGTDAAWSTEPAVAGVWTHLTGVYDAETRKLRIYVNGVRSGEGSRTAEPWNATGSVQIGRTTWGQDPASHQFPGSIDEVAIWDRTLSDAEVRSAVSRDNVQVGHWRFDEPAGTTTATNAVNGGASGVLTGGAAFTTPGVVDGSLKLDGATGAVTMAGPQLRTDRSFTVAGWAEISRQPTASGAATIVSQDGVHRSGFALQYRAISGNPDSGHWWILLPNADGATAGENTVVSSTLPTKVGKRAHVAAVYDAATRAVRLYVDGKLAGEGVRTGGFHATGAFTIGRGQWNGQPTDYLPGLVDEVRAYSRPLALAEIQGLVSQNNVTEGQWKLDGGFGDTSGKGRHGTQAETVGFTGGQTSAPDPSDLALALDGNGYVSAPKALDTSVSFSVSAWARLDRVGGHPVVVSQDGAFVSAFQLQATPDGHWAFVLFSHDRTDGGDTHHRIVGPAAQVGVWTHLVGVYDAPARQLQLYVNGAPAASGSGPVMWNHATGQVQIGAAKWNEQRSDRFPGAIDDVSLYNRVLFADEVRTQAGRDLSLVHNWTFDEPSGANAADSVGSRAAALSGGYQREVGRSGNAVRFNGTSGAASTSKVDLRTDQSFTVSAWVHMNAVQCADPYVGCRRDAVTVDGAQTSKFRLGHLVDDGDNTAGSWIFEMPESDTSPAVARAAVSVATGEIKNWVHLVGVYDAPSKTIWLYVDAVRQKDGALDASWQSTGGVAIGRGRVAGQPANHFPGMVDDVRLYAGVLDKNRVATLKASYPVEAATAPLPTDPIGYWKLDEGTGTTGADASGNDRPVTMSGGSGWIGGRKNTAMRLDGTSAWAGTTGPVIDTTGDFSVATWTYLNATTANRTLVAQDAKRVSAFALRYHKATGEWAVLAPSADIDNPPAVLLTSTEAAALSEWTHLAVTYHRASRQLKLYVNGVLSAARTEVLTIPSTGPLTLGRGKWNGGDADFYRYGIDDVRAFGRLLSAGEVRAIHDDAAPMRSGRYTFDDGTPNDASGRGNHAEAHTSGVSYGPGLSGRALVLDGVEGRVAAPAFGVSTRDSFTVSGWANLSRKDRVATVFGQDGDRTSSFFLQYRPAPDRWVFGHYQQDADGAAAIYAQSLQAPAAGKWTHLAGVYDYAARQLRLYVDGELAGTKDGVALWAGNGKFTIGRSKAGGAADGVFPGSIDEVLAYQGIQSAAEIARMGWPTAPGGQLGRFRNTAGDRYTGPTGETPRAGYHFEGTLGAPVTGDRPETQPLYACLAGADGFTSTDAACEGATVAGELGRVYTRQPANVANIPIYRCDGAGDRFESRRSDCEAAGVQQGVLGYTLAYGQMGRYSVHGDHWQGVDAAPHGYQYEGPLGWLPLVSQPGTVPLYMCQDGADQFVSTDGTCGGKTVAGVVAEIWPTEPSDMDSKTVYACRLSGQRFVDFSPTCAGHTVDGLLGYVLRGVFNPSPVFS
ncbi:LamG domain-containing protein [Actinomycetes bacterium KLBMP 9797]